MNLLQFEISHQSFIVNKIFYANNFASPVKVVSISISISNSSFALEETVKDNVLLVTNNNMYYKL